MSCAGCSDRKEMRGFNFVACAMLCTISVAAVVVVVAVPITNTDSGGVMTVDGDMKIDTPQEALIETEQNARPGKKQGGGGGGGGGKKGGKKSGPCPVRPRGVAACNACAANQKARCIASANCLLKLAASPTKAVCTAACKGADPNLLRSCLAKAGGGGSKRGSSRGGGGGGGGGRGGKKTGVKRGGTPPRKRGGPPPKRGGAPTKPAARSPIPKKPAGGTPKPPKPAKPAKPAKSAGATAGTTPPKSEATTKCPTKPAAESDCAVCKEEPAKNQCLIYARSTACRAKLASPALTTAQCNEVCKIASPKLLRTCLSKVSAGERAANCPATPKTEAECSGCKGQGKKKCRQSVRAKSGACKPRPQSATDCAACKGDAIQKCVAALKAHKKKTNKTCPEGRPATKELCQNCQSKSKIKACEDLFEAGPNCPAEPADAKACESCSERAKPNCLHKLCSTAPKNAADCDKCTDKALRALCMTAVGGCPKMPKTLDQCSKVACPIPADQKACISAVENDPTATATAAECKAAEDAAWKQLQSDLSANPKTDVKDVKDRLSKNADALHTCCSKVKSSTNVYRACIEHGQSHKDPTTGKRMYRYRYLYWYSLL